MLWYISFPALARIRVRVSSSRRLLAGCDRFLSLQTGTLLHCNPEPVLLADNHPRFIPSQAFSDDNVETIATSGICSVGNQVIFFSTESSTPRLSDADMLHIHLCMQKWVVPKILSRQPKQKGIEIDNVHRQENPPHIANKEKRIQPECYASSLSPGTKSWNKK